MAATNGIDPEKTAVRTPVQNFQNKVSAGVDNLAAKANSLAGAAIDRSPKLQTAIGKSDFLMQNVARNPSIPIGEKASNRIGSSWDARITGDSTARTLAKNAAESDAKAAYNQPGYKPQATALPGYRPSVDPDMTQQFKPLTAEDLSRSAPPTHNDSVRMQQNRAAGVQHVSPDGVVEPPASTIGRTGAAPPQPAPVGGNVDRAYANRPLSAEGAAWQKQQASQPSLQQPAQQPFQQAVNNTQQEAVKAAQSSTKGAMQAAMDKGKSFAGSAADKASSIGRSASEFAKSSTGKLGAAGLLAATAMDTAQTPTEQYATRFGIERSGESLPKDIAIRSLGAASDLATNIPIVGGIIKQGLFRDQEGNAESVDSAVKDGVSDFAGLASAAGLQKVANKVPGKLGKVLQAGAALAGYAGGNAAADSIMSEGEKVAKNEIDHYGEPSQQITGKKPGENGANNGLSLSAGGNGYMMDGSSPKSGRFSDSNVDLAALAEKSRSNDGGKSSQLAESIPRMQQAIGSDLPQGKRGMVKIIKDSATEKRNAEVTAREAAGSMKNMSDRARAEIATEQQKNLDAQQIAAQKLGLDASQLSIEGQKAASLMQGNQMDAAVKGSALVDAADARTLRKQLMTEQDPAKRQAIEDQLSYMSNGGNNRYSTIANMDGTTSVFDKRTGSIMPAESLAAM